MTWEEFMEGFWKRHPGLKGLSPDAVSLVARKAPSPPKEFNVVSLDASQAAPFRDWKAAASEGDWDGVEDEPLL